ncbi:MAG: phosphoglucosamine mutase [Cellvibrionales bacterium]|nr:phosphoglucosamine mutase [Cellvibrionales bacterium]
MGKQFFGTDGIRGKVGEYPVTPDFVLRLGWGIGSYIKSQYPDESSIVVIGKDTRISGYMFESALQAGLVAAGVNVKLMGPMPTPAVAYITRTLRAKMGIVISASHNPYYDNGIKLFSEKGTKLDDEAEFAIESALLSDVLTTPSEKLGKVTRINDAAGRYIEYCKSTVSSGFSLTGTKIVVDCAHGATYHVADKVFKELDASVVTLGTEPNGLNINDKLGSTSPAQLQAKVVEENADFGIAFDGDGDRVIFVDSLGNVVDGDQLIYLIATQMDASQLGQSGVVGTLMTNMGIENALKDKGFQFYRAKVGDRYVKEAMIDHGWILGGESSGHIICSDVSTTGDGIISALKVLSAINSQSKPLHELLADVALYPQKMINVKVKNQKAICEHPEIKAAAEQAEAELNGKGRVLLRPSGTEPLVRVMVEAKEMALVEQHVEHLAQVVRDIAIA